MFKKTIAMPFALAAAIVGVSALTADTAHAQRFRYGVNGRTAVRVVTPGNRVISTSPVYSTNGRVYYNNGYTNQGYNQPYRSYRPAYPGTYYNTPTYYSSPGTYYSTPGYSYSPYNSYYNGYGYSTPYYGTPASK